MIAVSLGTNLWNPLALQTSLPKRGPIVKQ